MHRAHGISQVPQPPKAPQPPAASTRGLSRQTRMNICRFLILGWTKAIIANRECCSIHAVNNVFNNLTEHGSIRKPPEKVLGRPYKISVEDGEALFEELIRSGWMYHDEMAYWLWMERGVACHRSTVCRYLNAQGWTQRAIKPFSINRNEQLQESYRVSMRRFAAEDLVFLDESIFNEKTGWRHKAYGPIGSEARYTQDIKRGDTWAILPAYTINGYLPCTGMKMGYYNHEEFVAWIQELLLPTLTSIYGNKPMVIVLDNVSIHTNDDIAHLIESAGHMMRYLPPYSPDYNPIELTFGVLKAWIQRNYVYTRANYDGFGAFLGASIRQSKCDRFAWEHFKHAAGGLYIKQEELDRLHDEMREEVRVAMRAAGRVERVVFV